MNNERILWLLFEYIDAKFASHVNDSDENDWMVQRLRKDLEIAFSQLDKEF